MGIDLATWGDQLASAVREKSSPLVVGIDPRTGSLPSPLREDAEAGPAHAAEAYATFGCEVIDAVAPYTAAVKPQAAFFEALGPPGMTALAKVIQHARRASLPVILDGKRNDIGSTATAYAEGYLGQSSPWAVDALTVSPYLGEDSLIPFADVCHQRDAGIFVLVKTSNPGGGMFQDVQSADGRAIFHRVADLVEQLAAEKAGASGYGSVGAVVGATYPEQLAELRERMPHAWLLIPGFGAQGGSADDVAGGFDSAGLGAVVNSSRGVIFAYNNERFASQAAKSWQAAVAAAAQLAQQQLQAVSKL